MRIALPGVCVGKDEGWGNPGDVLSEVEVGRGLRRSWIRQVENLLTHRRPDGRRTGVYS